MPVSMIERAVFSYFNPDENYGNTSGFKTFGDFLFTMALAALTASRHFKEVQMVSSDWGINIFQKIGLPITEYSNKLNEMKGISKYWWARGKMMAYEMQEVPFVHIDNDVFLWKPLPKKVLEAELCFQSKEYHNLPGYGYYTLLKNTTWNKATVRPQIIVDNEITDYCYNCGICGGHNLEFFKEWLQVSADYIFAPENNKLFFVTRKDVLIHQNLFHEQYFAASLVKAHGLRDKVEVIADHITDIVQVTDKGYTHLWGTTKRDDPMMRRVRLRLQKEDASLFERVSKFVKDAK